MKNAVEAAVMGRLSAEGSTRAISLVRVGLALLLWSRFANELQPFTAHGVPWLVLGAAFYLSTTLLFVGYRTRMATLATACVVWTMVFFVGRSGAVAGWTHHHTTLLAYATAMLIATPCGGSFSVDRLLAVRRARREGQPIPPERGPLWGTTMLGVLVSTIYFWGGVDKVTVAFLSGARLEQIFVWAYATSDFVAPPAMQGILMVGAVGITVLEFVLPFALWVRRWHWWVLPTGVVIHAAFYLLLPWVYTYTNTMLLLYLVFLDPEDVHRAIDDMLAGVGAAPRSP